MKHYHQLIQGGLLVAVFLLAITGIGWTDKNPPFKNGTWRAELHRADGQQIVFNFETKDSGGKKVLYVINGDERLLVDSIRQSRDSVWIYMPFFDSYFKASLDMQGNLEGEWIKGAGGRQQVMPFRALYNIKQRFVTTGRPRSDITGRWAVQFSGRNGKVREAVGEFIQVGKRVTGTFLTATGDYRYLEGVVAGDSIHLSAFDGSHAFLFTARLENDSTIMGGQFFSGAAGLERWQARKDENVPLPDGYDQAHLKGEDSTLSFRFKSINGEEVSLSDSGYQNKVVVVQVMGSWCPNCMDETRFLSDFYNSNRQRGIEVVALAYERTTNFEQSRSSLQRFQKRFNVQYPMLITGVTVSDPLRSEKTLPQLDRITAFPMTIFLDKRGRVRKIHSGFNGPGTMGHYEQFQKEFNQTIDGLLQEK